MHQSYIWNYVLVMQIPVMHAVYATEGGIHNKALSVVSYSINIKIVLWTNVDGVCSVYCSDSDRVICGI